MRPTGFHGPPDCYFTELNRSSIAFQFTTFRHPGAIRVCRRDDVQGAALLYQPGPAGTEPAHARGVQFLFEVLDAPEGGIDGRGHVPARRAAGARRPDVPA